MPPSHGKTVMKSSLILSLLVMIGCASAERGMRSGYDPETGATTYTSSKVLAGNIDAAAGLLSGQHVSMRAVASCAGEDCRPSLVDLVFLNDSSKDLSLDYRRVQIRFGGMSFDWEDLERHNEPRHYMVPRGEFIRVPMSWTDFSRMAASREVAIIFGLTGTRTIIVPHTRLAAFRDLVEAVEDAGVSATHQ